MAPATPPDPATPPLAEWEFRETVLLRKSTLSSSLLIWTALASTGLVAVWAIAAPLTQSVAVCGRLMPPSGGWWMPCW